MKTITFVLPNYSRVPIGGYKIVFEYANRLCKDGFKVKIVFLNNHALEEYKAPKCIKNIIIKYFTRREPRWLQLDTRIEKISAINFKRNINTNIVIATAATTVNYVNYNFKNAKKIYLIQDFENWNMSNMEVTNTYNIGFQNIVIAKWLKKVVDSYSKMPSVYIQNPINTKIYRVINPIDKRNNLKIGMLYHVRPNKGSKYAIEALKKVKEIYPKLEVEVFGATPRPQNLPDWFKYTENATQQQTVNIYNNISIFVNSSVKEGFGLTGLEAMACGAALISTDYDGVKEYAKNKVNSLLCPIRNSEILSKNIEFLIENPQKRIELANRGHETAKSFSWDIAYRKFKETILK